MNNLSPRQKKILLALLGAGGLALLVLVGRRAGGTTAAAPDAGDLGATSTIPTFADNGAQAAGLSTDVTSALGDVATQLSQLPDLVGAAVAANVPTQGTVDQAPAGPSADDIAAGFAAAFAPIAQAFSQSGAQNSSVTKAAVSATKAPVVATSGAQAPKVVATHGDTPGTKYTVTENVKRGGVVGELHHYSDGHNVFVPRVRTP